MKTAHQVRADDRMVLARALCSWSGSARHAIEIPNHRAFYLRERDVPEDGVPLLYSGNAPMRGSFLANWAVFREVGLFRVESSDLLSIIKNE